MRNQRLPWLRLAVLALFAGRLFAGGADEQSFYGEIIDSQCALNVHSATRSHSEMMEAFKDAMGTTPADCTQYCVKQMGGRYMLKTKSAVYKLEPQELVEKSAGMRVKLNGKLDPATKTIRMRSVQPWTGKEQKKPSPKANKPA